MWVRAASVHWSCNVVSSLHILFFSLCSCFQPFRFCLQVPWWKINTLVEHVHKAGCVTSVSDRAVFGISSNGPLLTTSPWIGRLSARISSQQADCWMCEKQSGVICLLLANENIWAKSLRIAWSCNAFNKHLTYWTLCAKAIGVIVSPNFNYVPFY